LPFRRAIGTATTAKLRRRRRLLFADDVIVGTRLHSASDEQRRSLGSLMLPF